MPAPHVSRNPTVNASLGGAQAKVALCAPHLAHAMGLESAFAWQSGLELQKVGDNLPAIGHGRLCLSLVLALPTFRGGGIWLLGITNSQIPSGIHILCL